MVQFSPRPQFSPFRCGFLAAVLSIWVWSKEAQGEFLQKKWAFDLFFGCGKTQKASVVYIYLYDLTRFKMWSKRRRIAHNYVWTTWKPRSSLGFDCPNHLLSPWGRWGRFEERVLQATLVGVSGEGEEMVAPLV
jgi:hypothetical protein